MTSARCHESCLAFACFLTLLIGGVILVQTIGNWLNLALARYALLIAAAPALWWTYRRWFPLTWQHALTGAGIALMLAVLGLASAALPDMSWDGIAYQQPAAEAILNGWNPLRGGAAMLWQNIYPSGVWMAEASLASLYGTIEAAKALQVWWLFIAAATVYAGLSAHFAPLGPRRILLLLAMLLSPTVVVQLLTHYVDSMLYLAGLAFLGGLLLHGHSRRESQAGLAIMAVAVLFMVNVKLSGIYHAVVWCAAATAWAWMREKQIPWRLSRFLLLVGVIATLGVGYRPYVTNILTYGSLLHMEGAAFSGAQRPVNLAEMPAPQRFLYSLFSQTGGEMARAPAALKWPWRIYAEELEVAGYPDARAGGFGPLFALAALGSLILCIWHVGQRRTVHAGLLLLAGICLVSSLLFPEGWWMRYVPFAYAAPLLLLLALGEPGKVGRYGMVVVIGLFLVNILIVAQGAWRFQKAAERRFDHTVAQLRQASAGSAFLVPPGSDYHIYNGAYLTLQRRLAERGIEVSIRVDAPCERQAGEAADFKLCY